MPLAAHRDLPSLAVLRGEGIDVLDDPRTCPQLSIGILNLMPDAVFQATERQWMRLCSGFEDAAVCVFPFTFNADARSKPARDYIDCYYESYEAIRDRGLDLLIVTGANPHTADITDESYWELMIEAVMWARDRGTAVVCSCLATHGVVKQLYGIDRICLPQKCWGVYDHTVLQPEHSLIRNIDSGWQGPHSHIYGVTRGQLESAGIEVLVDNPEAEAYLAVSPDFPEFVFLQGHPEYDAIGLLKEFRRELQRFAEGEIAAFPPVPESYFDERAMDIISRHRGSLSASASRSDWIEAFPEAELASRLTAPWRTTGQTLIENLLGEILNAK